MEHCVPALPAVQLPSATLVSLDDIQPAEARVYIEICRIVIPFG
jgi:hypothetical protein